VKLLKDGVGFLKAVVQDPRIPERDKQVLTGLLVLIVSPVDLIPDWIPVIGQLDDLVMIALVLDYFFTVLDSEVLLSHWPWDMKAFARLRRMAKLAGFFAPRFLKKMVWKYVGSPY
jgi:uncharacterized membrane protein YkvA (DUF1232 family)